MGVQTSMELVERVRKNALKEQTASAARLRKILSDEIADLLFELPRPRVFGRGPVLTLVVGVNGVGKTTSIAKIARRAIRGQQGAARRGRHLPRRGHRATRVWGDRLGRRGRPPGAGGRPGAVVYDAIHAAKARKIDVIVDTAGRLHTKDHLMAELGKVRRVIDREAPDWAKRDDPGARRDHGAERARPGQEFARGCLDGCSSPS